MGRLIATLSSTFVLVIVAACSSSSSSDAPAPTADGGAEGGVVSAEDFCKAAWTKLCAGRQKCQPYAFGDWNHGDMNDCITQQTAACLVVTKGATITQATKDCLDATDVSVCTTYYEVTTAGLRCDYHGAAADGAPCFSTDQCQHGCRITPGYRCGACAPLVEEGGATENGEACVAGTVNLDGKCRKLRNAGESCGNASNVCNPFLVCDATSSTCGDQPAIGAACGAANACGPENQCVSAKCEGLTQAKIGEPCGVLESGSVANCVAGAKCKLNDPLASPQTNRGTCFAEIADGQPCDGIWFFGGQCHFPAQCRDGKCQPPSSFCESVPAAPVKPTTCSAPGMVPAVDMTFKNDFPDRDISIFWIDPSCNEKSYGIIPAKTSGLLKTFVGHVWRIRDPDTGEIVKDGVAAPDTNPLTVTFP